MALFEGYILAESTNKIGITTTRESYIGTAVNNKTGITNSREGYIGTDETFLQGSNSPNNLGRVSLNLSSSQQDSPVVVTGHVSLPLSSKQGVTISDVHWDPTTTSPSTTLSNNNLTATNDVFNYHPARANVGRSSGKHVFEVEVGTNSSTISVGLSAGDPFTTSTFSLGLSNTASIDSIGRRTSHAQYHENGVLIGTTASFPTNIAGDVIQVRVDFDSKQISINLYRPSTQTFLTTDGFIPFNLSIPLFPSASAFTAGRSVALHATEATLLAPAGDFLPWNLTLDGDVLTFGKGLSLGYIQESSQSLQGLSALSLSYLQQAAVILQEESGLSLSYAQEKAVIANTNSALNLAYSQEKAVIANADKSISLAHTQEKAVIANANSALSLAYVQELQNIVTRYKSISLASLQQSDVITHRSWRIIFDSQNSSTNNTVRIRDIKFYKNNVEQTGSGGLVTFGSPGPSLPEFAFDGSISTGWASDNASPISGQYIGRDFGAGVGIDFDEIRIISEPESTSNGSPNTLRVQYSDDPNPATATDWQTHWTLSNQTNWEEQNSFTADTTGSSGAISLAYAMAQEDTNSGNLGLSLSYLQEPYVILQGLSALSLASAIEEQTVDPNTFAALSDSMSLSLSPIEVFTIYKLTDTLTISSDKIVAPLSTFAGLKSAMAMNDLVNLGFLAEIRENISLADNPQALLYLISRISEEIALSDSVSTTAQIVGSLVDAFTLAEILLAGQVASVSENITLTSDVSDVLKAFTKVQEQLTLHFEQGAGTAIHVFAKLAENLSLDDSLSSAAVLQAMLEDGMALITLPDPFGDTQGIRTGWVMNPETFSVWNYENMNFNSLTYYEQQGLMASSQGLFKTNDSAEDTLTLDPITNPALVSRITSTLKTASIDFGNSSLKQVPQMYLGLDMDGEVTLVVNTDEKVEVRYKLIKPTTHSNVQDIKIGKGLIGSQWQFELIDSTSDDFELNFIELLPIVFGRKTR